jgi:co-chaperonin GroES (HSP10)
MAGLMPSLRAASNRAVSFQCRRAMSSGVGMKPLLNRVLVHRGDSKEETSGGIIIPEQYQTKVNEGTVVAVGPGARDKDGGIIPMALSVDDKVGPACRRGERPSCLSPARPPPRLPASPALLHAAAECRRTLPTRVARQDRAMVDRNCTVASLRSNTNRQSQIEPVTLQKAGP